MHFNWSGDSGNSDYTADSGESGEFHVILVILLSSAYLDAFTNFANFGFFWQIWTIFTNWGNFFLRIWTCFMISELFCKFGQWSPSGLQLVTVGNGLFQIAIESFGTNDGKLNWILFSWYCLKLEGLICSCHYDDPQTKPKMSTNYFGRVREFLNAKDCETSECRGNC